MGTELGWDRPSSIPGTYRSARVTTIENGIRANGSKLQLPDRPLVLAAGDSFTFGGRVSDHQTWPSILEEQLSIRVLNAGVPAYGLDQAVLRAQQLSEVYAPDLVIVSFINSDLQRATFSAYGRAKKPSFRVVEGQLELVDTPSGEAEIELDLFRRVLGYSQFTDWVMRRVAPRYWTLGRAQSTGENGVEIGCLLMARLRDLGRGLGVEVLVVLQKEDPGEALGKGPEVLACARAQGLSTLNLFPAFEQVSSADATRYEGFFFGHMTPDGNRFVAEALATRIRESGWMDK